RRAHRNPSKIAHALARAIGDIARGPAAPISSSAQIRRALAKFDFHKPMPVDDAATEVIEPIEEGHGAHDASGLLRAFQSERDISWHGRRPDHCRNQPAARGLVARPGSRGDRAPHHRRGRRALVVDHRSGCGSLYDRANYTAVIIALTRQFPEFANTGARALPLSHAYMFLPRAIWPGSRSHIRPASGGMAYAWSELTVWVA